MSLCALGSQMLLQGLEPGGLRGEKERQGPGPKAVVLRLRLNTGKVSACHHKHIIRFWAAQPCC